MTEVSTDSWTFSRRASHYLAIATLLATVPLLFSGGQVTSYGVGMAVPDWPTTFGQNMWLYNWLRESPGVQKEHTHRLLGTLVGSLTLALTVLVFATEKRRWLRRYTLVVLAGVLLQGIIGGQRVVLNAMFGQGLALIHGGFAQAFFGLLCGLVVLTSRRWLVGNQIPHEEATRWRWSTLVLCVGVFGQILLGATLRHLGIGFIPHLVLGGVILMGTLWMGMSFLLDGDLRRVGGLHASLLLAFVGIQVLLGFAAMSLTGLHAPGVGPAPTVEEALVTTLHLLCGSAIFGLALALTLRTWSELQPLEATADAGAPSGVLEAVG
ncbi:Heme A synthase [Planctomycetes bacterium Pan216]|uniref:Heme A synthase n=1 Tax=Kolteria novifilia TaxID=2527975 RepID=A0A518B7Z7_9BACT|nr:Heme A synthase [Planctomycetes bacterium Pan216]